MSDIAKKFRDACVIDPHYGKSIKMTCGYDDFMAAANELDRLRAEVERLNNLRKADLEEYRQHVRHLIPEVERLRAALREIDAVPAVKMLTDFGSIKEMQRIARAALNGEPRT